MPHAHSHAFGYLNAARRDGLVLSRRNLLKAGLAGVGGLTLPALLHARESTRTSPKSVILLWMAGGPSQIDTWDPKPDRPPENRGPFGVIKTKLPGVIVCEHLPKLAAMLDRFTVIRSVDRTAQQPRAEHGDADGEPARRAARRTPKPAATPRSRRWSPSSAGPTTRNAAVRRVHAVAQPPRVRRPARQELRPVPRERGRPASRLRSRRQRHRATLRREDVRAARGRVRGPHGRPAAVAQELRPPPRGHRHVRLDGGPRQVRTAGGGDAHRRAGAGRARPREGTARPPATATASTCGASRRCSRGGWSRPAPRSSRST